MKVTHSPNLELHLTEKQDLELVLHNVIRHAIKKDRRARSSLEDIRSRLDTADKVTIQELDTTGDELKRPVILVSSDAHLAVRAIDMFVEDTLADRRAGPWELHMAQYGRQVLEMVRADIPAENNS